MFQKRGFTIIELIVVIGIIALLTALILPNYRRGQESFALQRSATKLAQDLRRAQEMAMSAKKFQACTDSEYKYGYGIYLKEIEPDHYLLFADCNGNGDYDSGRDEIVEDINFEKDVKINKLSKTSLRITFTPPDPTVSIKPNPPAWIELSINTSSKIIRVNTAGLISVE